MGIMLWDQGGGFSIPPVVRTPRMTIRCEYPDTDLEPTYVTFRLSPSYGLTTGHEANEWFIDMMYDYEEGPRRGSKGRPPSKVRKLCRDAFEAGIPMITAPGCRETHQESLEPPERVADI